MAAPQPDLEVVAVDSNRLPAPQTSQSGAMAMDGPADSLLVAEPQQKEPQQADEILTPVDQTVLASTGTRLQLDLTESSNGSVLLLPNTNPNQPLQPSAASTSAYASPETETEIGSSAVVSLLPGGGLLENGDGGFSIGSQTTPVIDPLEAAAQSRIPLLHSSIDHGQCEGGFGPKPKRIGASRINQGDPYYIEIRMRQTPLLPVGHTYVAYGRLGADGEPLDEKLIMLAPMGGYAGAALASGIPMPGILTPHRDDCRIRPDVGYRVSLNAQRFEKLLTEVRDAKADKPSYLLLAYNCNHFMTRIAGSVGILPPKNIYLPAVQYLYAMIERNEGQVVARR